jgi:transposase-like protein
VRVKRENQEFSAEELNLITLAQEYSDEDRARSLLESLRWPKGPVCPHCKAEKPYVLTPKTDSKRPGRKGLYKCRECRKQFTVTVGTVFEDSHINLSKWLMAIFLLCSSKKAMSAHQLHRMLGITYKTAWFMAHRIRYAMGPENPLGKMLEGTVEYDETYVGGKVRHGDKKLTPETSGYRKNTKKVPVVALVERGGEVRTKVVTKVNHKNIRDFIKGNISKKAFVNTDATPMYRNAFQDFERHDQVDHGRKEYARHNADGTCSHVNTAESFFSLIKRGIYGSWHNVSREHLPKYMDEFAFRWNSRKLKDGERFTAAIKTIEGKRLKYRDS